MAVAITIGDSGSVGFLFNEMLCGRCSFSSFNSFLTEAKTPAHLDRKGL